MKNLSKRLTDYWFDYFRLAVSAYLILVVTTRPHPVEKKIAVMNALIGLWAYKEEKKTEEPVDAPKKETPKSE